MDTQLPTHRGWLTGWIWLGWPVSLPRCSSAGSYSWSISYSLYHLERFTVSSETKAWEWRWKCMSTYPTSMCKTTLDGLFPKNSYKLHALFSDFFFFYGYTFASSESIFLVLLICSLFSSKFIVVVTSLSLKAITGNLLCYWSSTYF